jgi:succinoglycan biosynthesis protein ExoA
MLELGGFNEALYPNEENALMDELQKRGGKLIYDPAFIVHRRPRNNLKAFAKMLLNYGRGRAEQFRLTPTAGSAPNFVPPLFCVYLVALLAIGIFGNGRFLTVLCVPLGFYVLALMVQAAALVPQGGIFRSVCAIPLMLLTHILYGAGFWRGLFTSLKPPEAKDKPTVTVESAAF